MKTKTNKIDFILFCVEEIIYLAWCRSHLLNLECFKQLFMKELVTCLWRERGKLRFPVLFEPIGCWFCRRTLLFTPARILDFTIFVILLRITKATNEWLAMHTSCVYLAYSLCSALLMMNLYFPPKLYRL